MALINCPECGKEVSDQAEKCIYCGFPLEQLSTISMKKKTSLKKIIGIALLIFVLLMGTFFIIITISPDGKYKIAEHAFESGNYSKAMKIYSKILDYEDSSEKFEQATILFNYNSGKEAMEEMNWEKAKDYFTLCSEYEDSKDLISNCDYQIACSLLENDVNEAKRIFGALNNYKDSYNKLCECNYILATSEADQGNEMEAARLYGESEGYNNADELIILIGEKYVSQENYKDAITVLNYIRTNNAVAKKMSYYAKGKQCLLDKDLSGASNAFVLAEDYLDSKELYTTSSYDYAVSLLDKKNYSIAHSWLNKVIDYRDARKLAEVCNMMETKEEIVAGNLNKAKIDLEKMDAKLEYDGTSVAGLLNLLEKNNAWVNLSGKWTSTSGQMRTTQHGYTSYWWYRDFEEGDESIEVRCSINDNGKINVSIKGSIPIYTNYSSIRSALEISMKSISVEKEMTSLGTITIDKNTSITLSSSKVVVNYKMNDNNRNVYFNYTYKTDITFGKKTESF